MLVVSVFSFAAHAQTSSGDERLMEIAKANIHRMSVIAFLTPEQEKEVLAYEFDSLKRRGEIRAEFSNDREVLKTKMKELNVEYYIKVKSIIGIGNMQSWMEYQN